MDSVACNGSAVAAAADDSGAAAAAAAAARGVICAMDYHAVCERMEQEVQHCARLQRQLDDARVQVARLRQQLNSFVCTNGTTATTSTAPGTASSTEAAHKQVQQRQVAPHNAPHHHHHHHHHHHQQQQRHVSHHAHARGEDKEALSLCSDVSARAGPDDGGKRGGKRAVGAGGGIRKKSVSKKERSQKAKIAGQSRYWTPDEHKLFLEAIAKYGYKNLRAISEYVGTRNMTQVRTHSQKYFMRLMREAKRQNPGQGDGRSGSGALPGGGARAVHDDKYSVPNTCGMTLLCLVGQDTLPS